MAENIVGLRTLWPARLCALVPASPGFTAELSTACTAKVCRPPGVILCFCLLQAVRQLAQPSSPCSSRVHCGPTYCRAPRTTSSSIPSPALPTTRRSRGPTREQSAHPDPKIVAEHANPPGRSTTRMVIEQHVIGPSPHQALWTLHAYICQVRSNLSDLPHQCGLLTFGCQYANWGFSSRGKLPAAGAAIRSDLSWLYAWCVNIKHV